MFPKQGRYIILRYEETSFFWHMFDSTFDIVIVWKCHLKSGGTMQFNEIILKNLP